MANRENIRNIGIMAHIDAGKTTTTERILFYSGRIHRMGEVHDGNATMDWMDQEQDRGITITSAVTSFSWKKRQINIIDTPGHVDFTAEVERSLRVLDGAVGVFCGVGGVEPQSETVWAQSERYNIPKIAYVNKLDRMGADFERTLEDIRERLSPGALAIQFPIGKEADFKAIVDVVRGVAYYFDQEEYGSNMVEKEIPEEAQDEYNMYRELLLDVLSEHDDSLMEKILEERELTANEIVPVLRKATISLKVTPVLCGSSFKNMGVRLLMDAIGDLLPSPVDKPDFQIIKDGKLSTLAPADNVPLALIYKIQIDKHVGKLLYARVYSGTIKKGDTLTNQDTGKKERVMRILQMHSNKTKDLNEISYGDIATFVGPKDVKTGQTLAGRGVKFELPKMNFPEAVISMVVEPETKGDYDKLMDSLKRLEDEDPTFFVKEDKNSGQIVISGMGELHLEVLVYRLKNEFGVNANVGTPQVAYRETILDSVEFEEEFDRELKGKKHYAKVKVQISPLLDSEEKSKNVYEMAVTKGDLSPEFLRAIKEGALGGCAAGPIFSWAVRNVKIEVVNVETKEGESSELAFSIATSTAVSRALSEARATFLEPIVKAVVLSPEEYVGDIIADLNGKRGKVLDIKHMEARQQVVCEVPVSELFGYTTRLRNLSKGRASMSMEFLKYDLVPEKIKEAIIEKTRGY